MDLSDKEKELISRGLWALIEDERAKFKALNGGPTTISELNLKRCAHIVSRIDAAAELMEKLGHPCGVDGGES